MTTPGTVGELSADELVPLLDDASLLLVDVREPDEFTAWHIAGSLNVPLGELEARVGELDTSRHLVTVCAAGPRAERAAALLAAHGLDAQVLSGGMESWGRASDVVEVTLAGALIAQVRRRGKGCLSYVVGAGERAIVIDPSGDLDTYSWIARRNGFAITHVLDTHLHADHVSGARELAQRWEAELWLNPADGFDFAFHALGDGQRIELNPTTHLVVSALSAPGHTRGSTVFRLGDAALFTGDTLFLDSVGRPDLADEAEAFAHALHASLHQVVLPLGDDIVVLPAHYGDSTTVTMGHLVAAELGDLRRTLPALAYDEDTFVRWAVERVRDRPPNYVEIVKVNAGLSTKTLGELRELELGPNRCAIAG